MRSSLDVTGTLKLLSPYDTGVVYPTLSFKFALFAVNVCVCVTEYDYSGVLHTVQ